MKQPMIQNPMMSSSFPPTNITTDQIQKFLDENKQLILAIMNNQNLGKLAECAQYQALLQKNLMYLAAIADAQPPTPTPAPTPTPTISSQMTPVPHLGMQQQGGFYMQQQQHHPQAVMAHQPSGFPPQMAAMQFNSPQGIQAQMGGISGGPMHGEPTLRASAPTDVWRGGNSMQDGGGADGAKDGHGSAASGSEEAK
ncbi:GRF1-interacting factor 2-like isoform X2 [Cynara cardunculus var. scolymus]|uniref:SSXT-like protein n=1 Tax=Cynara cardunculus var. scolymus TaxID=59895 RepID=A0A103XEK8_CYNCS|nr:GRF1-interacting factor 2-like isoform X2 [Cynara cardunculus var. scolymus]KVH89312.1 SSXT-like protein [Cynara cardunculus var. scolymus]